MAPASRAQTVSASCSEDQHLERTCALLNGLVFNPSDRVLEVGCGTGQFFRELARIGPRGLRIVGIDSDAAVLEEATKNASLLDGVSVSRMDARALRFEDRSFDVVCCSRVLVHSSNPGLVLSEMARVLRPGGRFLGIEPAAAFCAGVDDDLRRRVHGQRNPCIGRDLPAMLEAVGIKTIDVLAHTFVDGATRTTEELRLEFRAKRGLFALACGARSCSTGDVEEYFARRERAEAQGYFYQCVVHMRVLGRKDPR
jgi:SAM-dependent methyltransferase